MLIARRAELIRPGSTHKMRAQLIKTRRQAVSDHPRSCPQPRARHTHSEINAETRDQRQPVARDSQAAQSKRDQDGKDQEIRALTGEISRGDQVPKKSTHNPSGSYVTCQGFPTDAAHLRCHALDMTSARSLLADSESPGFYHGIIRHVRLA